jgi:acyl-CoA synthetase (AMP-forming)/AMP-acid ligase II
MSGPAAPATLLDVLRAAPGERVAVVVPGAAGDGAVTYESLRQQVGDVAGSLAASGIGPGDRVAVALPNGLPVLVVILAAAAATAAPLNPAYRYDEFCFYLQDTRARLIVLPEEGAEDARRAAADGGVPVATAQSLAAGGSSRRVLDREPVPEDVALVLHTSGSTGRPKRVPLRHANVAASVVNVVDTYQLAASDVSLCVMPLFHVHGLVASRCPAPGPCTPAPSCEPTAVRSWPLDGSFAAPRWVSPATPIRRPRGCPRPEPWSRPGLRPACPP